MGDRANNSGKNSQSDKLIQISPLGGLQTGSILKINIIKNNTQNAKPLTY